MLKRIRELDLDTIVEQVRHATDVASGRACHALIQEELDQSPTVSERVESLRNYVGLAALDWVSSPDELKIDQPLVEAFVRTHHHPEAPPSFAPFKVPGKPPAGPRLAELAERHKDLAWDKEIVRALLWRGVQTNREHELDDAKPPWLMYWGKASGSAHALMLFVTYDAFGSLEGVDPKAEAARKQLEQQTVELARQMREAIERYDEPDMVAQREAYEREKDRRIGASLASFYIKTGQRETSESLDVAVGKMLRYFAHRVDTDVPDVGNAATVSQPLPTLDSGALVWLDLVARSSARELMLRIKSPDGKTTRSLLLLRGSKLRMITFLEEASTPGFVIAAIDELQRTP